MKLGRVWTLVTLLCVVCTEFQDVTGYRFGRPLIPAYANKRRPMMYKPTSNPTHTGLLLEWLQNVPNNFMNMKSRLKLGSAFEGAKNEHDILKLLASTAAQKQSVPTNTIYRNAKTKPFHPSIRFRYREEPWRP